MDSLGLKGYLWAHTKVRVIPFLLGAVEAVDWELPGALLSIQEEQGLPSLFLLPLVSEAYFCFSQTT